VRNKDARNITVHEAQVASLNLYESIQAFNKIIRTIYTILIV